MDDQPQIHHLRVIVEAADYDSAVHFYRDILGMPEQAAFAEGDEDRVAILQAGTASLEIASPTHRQAIDDVEAPGQVSPHIRLALEVDDTESMTDRAACAGATLIARPTRTPWQSLNSRLAAPAGLQITLFQELETLEQRSRRGGFTTEPNR